MQNSGSFKKGHVAHNKGKKGLFKHSTETKKKMMGKNISKDVRNKISLTLTGNIPWNKGRPNPNGRGEKCHLWRGGITPINKKIRQSLEYKLWRKAVFERDNFTCVWCGQRGGELNADHIKQFAFFPELRFAIDNGRTLCVPCHKTTDTHSNRKI